MRGLSRLLQAYEPGQKVVIDLAPGTVKGMPHRRYQGRVATIVGKRGRAYVLEVQMGGMLKTLISRPEHIRLLAG
jgi:large subunit ribosomal protein L21e